MRTRHEDLGARGLTVLELLVSMAVIAVLASIAIASWINFEHRAKQRSTMADMRTLSRAIESYSVDHGRLPDDSSGVSGWVTAGSVDDSQRLPVADHWGTPYHYVVVGQSYSLESFGRDGRDDTRGSRNYDRDLVLFNGTFTAAPE